MNVLIRHVAVADGTAPEPELERSVLVIDDAFAWLGPDADAPGPPTGCRVVDGGGTTLVPGLVDAHSHATLPGGSHWIARIGDDTDDLLATAEANGEMALRAGTRWFRDVGSPRRDGRALALEVRDRWRGRRDRPYIRVAGTWLARAGVLPPGVAFEVADADGLLRAVEEQIDDGADLVKLYLDGPDPDTAPWTGDEVTAAVSVAHGRGVKVTAHATQLAGARAGVHGGVDCIEHGTRLDADLAAAMAERATFVVPTLGVIASWESFATTTTIERFAGAGGRRALAERKEDAYHSVGLATAAGVAVAAGTDFGGGSLRANQMAWEVQCLVDAGLEPWEALAAATWRGGDLLGEPGAGRLAVGGPADFFLVHGDPLRDPSALWRVWWP
jgi:imidazolonepropionase-like amidohydrolase